MSDAKASLDLRPDHHAIVLSILKRHVPDREILAFGSRATWTAKDYSDLDLAILGDKPLPLDVTSALVEDFRESDLPFKVDLVDWAKADATFRKIIRRDGVTVQDPANSASIMARTRRSRSTGGNTDIADKWMSLPIAAIGRVVGGSTPSTTDPRNFNGDIPWLTPRDLSGTHDRWVSRGARNLSKRGLEACSAQLLPKGAVLLTTRAPIGYVALAANPIATNQGFRSVIVEAQHDPEFLYYWLKQNVAQLERYASGSTFKELSGSALKRISVLLPESKAEQRAIAHILGTLDDKIELNRRVSKTLEGMAQALFKSWFVDLDPVHAKMKGRDTRLPQPIADLFPDRMVSSEIGEIPYGWRVVPLPDLININPSRTLRKKEAAPYLPMSNMPTKGHFPDQVTTRPYGSGMRFKNGDTLVARITPCLENGKTAFVDFLLDGETGWGSTEYIVMRPKQPLPNEFAYCLARSTRFREFAIQNMTGTSGRQRLPAKALAQFPQIAPAKRVAEAFGDLIRPLIALASAAAKESRSTSGLRDAILPKLIAGELQAGVREGP